MTKASIRTLLAGMAGALALAASIPAAAQAIITITGAGCTSWQLTGSPPAQFLTCITGGQANTPPVCTVTGSNTGVTGTPQPLTARCIPEATSWAWVGVSPTVSNSCSGKTTATCMANDAGTVYYAVRGTNAAGPGPQSTTFTVGWQVAPPPAPTGCSIARNPATGTLASGGGAITVTGSCSGGGTPTAWNWQRNGVGWGTNTAMQGETLPANTGASPITYTYTLTACNGTSCAPASFATFTVAGAGGGGGPGAIDCTAGGNPYGFSATTVYNIPWGWGNNYDLVMAPDTAVIVWFTVPANAGVTPAGQIGHLDVYEWLGAQANRWVTLSTSPCTWTPFDGQWTQTGLEPVVRFAVSNTSLGYPSLAPGQTYYLNIQNRSPFPPSPPGPWTCSYAPCNPSVTMGKPGNS